VNIYYWFHKKPRVCSHLILTDAPLSVSVNGLRMTDKPWKAKQSQWWKIRSHRFDHIWPVSISFIQVYLFQIFTSGFKWSIFSGQKWTKSLAWPIRVRN